MGDGNRFELGLVVWARLEFFPWWPSVVIDRAIVEPRLHPEDEGKLPPTTATNRMVEFFNDNRRVAVVEVDRLEEFTGNMHLLRESFGEDRLDVITASREAEAYIEKKGSPAQQDLLLQNPLNLVAEMHDGSRTLHEPSTVVWALLRFRPWWPAIVVDPAVHDEPIALDTDCRTVQLLDDEQTTANVNVCNLREFTANMAKIADTDGADRDEVLSRCQQAQHFIRRNGLPWQVMSLRESPYPLHSGEQQRSESRFNPRVGFPSDSSHCGDDGAPPSPKRRCAEASKKIYRAPGKGDAVRPGGLQKTGLQSKAAPRDPRRAGSAARKPSERELERPKRSPKRRRDPSPSSPRGKTSVPGRASDRENQTECLKARHNTLSASGRAREEPRSVLSPDPSTHDCGLLVEVRDLAADCDVWAEQYREHRDLERKLDREHGIRGREAEVKRKFADIMKRIDHLDNNFSGSTHRPADVIAVLVEASSKIQNDSGMISEGLQKIAAKWKEKLPPAGDPSGGDGRGVERTPVYPQSEPVRRKVDRNRSSTTYEVLKEGTAPRPSPVHDKGVISEGKLRRKSRCVLQRRNDEVGDIPIPRRGSRYGADESGEKTGAQESHGGLGSRESPEDPNLSCPTDKEHELKETTKATSKARNAQESAGSPADNPGAAVRTEAENPRCGARNDRHLEKTRTQGAVKKGKIKKQKCPNPDMPRVARLPEWENGDQVQVYGQLVSLTMIDMVRSLTRVFLSANRRSVEAAEGRWKHVRVSMTMVLKGKNQKMSHERQELEVNDVYLLHQFFQQSGLCRDTLCDKN